MYCGTKEASKECSFNDLTHTSSQFPHQWCHKYGKQCLTWNGRQIFNNFSNSTTDGEKFRGSSWFYYIPFLISYSLVVTSDFLVIIYHYNLIFFYFKGKRQKGGWCEWICERSLLENSECIRFTFVCGLLEMYEKKTKLTAAFVSVSNFAYCSVCIFGRQ